MKRKIYNVSSAFLILVIIGACSNSTAKINNSTDQSIVYPSHNNPILQHFKLILGNGSNVGIPVNFQDQDFFYTTNDGKQEWVVYKTPNAGNTHGTSNNTRSELAQTKKWSALAGGTLSATCKVMNVSPTGDARVAASYSVVVGQIHSADGHENEPLKIFYKKFPGHSKGSVFWNYEINTAGDDNSGRWDYSYPVWGYDFSTVGADKNTFPAEPVDGIALGEEFSYEVKVKEGIMTVKFMSKGHNTKSFSKNLIQSEYVSKAEMPAQVKNLFVPIGQDGVERASAYADEGLFFKLGSYNQTNGKDPIVNKVWCSGAETHDGDLAKQYADGNFAEVWFKEASVEISDKAISNEGYFSANDGLNQKIVYPSEVIPFMDKFIMLMGDGTTVDNLLDFQDERFFYTVIDGTMRWVVYKTPNSGVTSKNSSNTRTELHEKREWTPEVGGKLTAACKVMHVSTSGDARVAASHSVVIGQIHSGEGHENEPCKIFYKKFPGHTKGSVFWNYEINTAGDDNSGRWDYSYPVWGHDFSIIGSSPGEYPEEPKDGIELGEEFRYEINVHKGIMYLTFESEGHETKTFTKNLIQSEYTTKEDLPEQTGADTYEGDIEKQYANGDYAEVWFKDATVSESTKPE